MECGIAWGGTRKQDSEGSIFGWFGRIYQELFAQTAVTGRKSVGMNEKSFNNITVLYSGRGRKRIKEKKRERDRQREKETEGERETDRDRQRERTW